jgi:hypothetical protein
LSAAVTHFGDVEISFLHEFILNIFSNSGNVSAKFSDAEVSPKATLHCNGRSRFRHANSVQQHFTNAPKASKNAKQ